LIDHFDILAQWQRLVLPPAPAPVRCGEQLSRGNRYPDADRFDAEAHLAGRSTYAVDLAYTDPDTGDLVAKAGVLDVDEGPENSPAVALALLLVALANGLAAALAWSGSKGCHVWIFSEPIALDTMRAVLKQLKDAVPHKGEIIPLDARRVKLAPALHQEAGTWSYWYPADIAPAPRADPPDLAEQADLLASLVPTPIRIMEAYAGSVCDIDISAHTDPTTTVPVLSNLQAPPSCIQALARRGGDPRLGTFDKNLLTMARYARTAGLDSESADRLAQPLIENVAPDLETGKDEAARWRCWRSQQDTPTLEDKPFNCLYMLRARESLDFDCGLCAARPKGLRVARRQSAETGSAARLNTGNPFRLEHALADQLLACALRHGHPPQRIEAGIFPPTVLPGPRGDLTIPVHGLVWAAAGAGANSAAAVADWIDHCPFPDLVVLDAETARAVRRDTDLQTTVRRAVTEAATALVARVLALPDLAEADARAVLNRAADLSARHHLTNTLETTRGRLAMPGQDLLGSIEDLSMVAASLQRDHYTEFGAPLAAFAPELLEGLIADQIPHVPTPFPHLNGLLAGGLQSGKMSVLVAPPGSGKTTLAAHIADHAAGMNIPVAFVAFEMGRPQLFDYALARAAGVNSAVVEARTYRRSAGDRELLAASADQYLTNTGSYLSVIEGDYFTTTAKLATWVVQARIRHGLAPDAPVLVVVDYLQLMNTGIEALDNGPQEILRLNQISVQLKQLARITGAAVLALSDITKEAQEAVFKGQGMTLNAPRGTNRIAHSADSVWALYSEPSVEDGGKAKVDPWAMMAAGMAGNARAVTAQRALDDARKRHRPGGSGAAVYSRLELLKNRGGQGKGSQLLMYERAFHRFQPVDIAGQAIAEGRG
jgi:replicative DNA helicase